MKPLIPPFILPLLALLTTHGLFFIPSIAHAEELERLQTDAGLTLAAIVERTFERSPLQPVLKAGEVEADANARHAQGILPTAPALIVRHQNDMVGSNRKLREWEAGVEVPVWMSGQRAAREAVARESRANQEAGRSGLKLSIAGEVRDAIWNIALNAKAADLAEQRLKTAQALQHDVERRQQAGELANTDVMLAQNDTLQAQTALLYARTELKHAEHRYWILTGLTKLPAMAEETLTTRQEPDEHHPLLAAASQKVVVAQEQRNLTRVEKRENPQVMINVRHDRGAFDSEYDSSIGLAVRIPLAAETRSAPLLAASEMQLAQAMSEREQLTLALQAAAHEAEHNLEVVRAELGIVGEQNRLAQESLRLARKAFELGETDLVNFLRVQKLAFEAEQAYGGSLIRLKQGIANYNQAMGVLP